MRRNWYIGPIQAFTGAPEVRTVVMKLVRSHLPILLLLLAVAVAFWLLPHVAWAGAPAQVPSCDGARVFIEGGQPSPFILPDFAGGKLRVDPSAVLEIRAENIPSGARLNWGLQGFGTKLASKKFAHTK